MFLVLKDIIRARLLIFVLRMIVLLLVMKMEKYSFILSKIKMV